MGPPTDYAIFDAHVCRSIHPATGKEKSFTVIQSPNWVNVIALTTDDQVVMVRQYRHGIDDLTLEIPGGIVDPGEDALTAVKRELYEETGLDLRSTEHDLIRVGRYEGGGRDPRGMPGRVVR